MWEVPLVLFIALLTVLWLCARWRHQHWQRMGVYSPPGLPILGHFLTNLNVGTISWDFRQKIYKETRDSKVYGLYEIFKPHLSINDIEVINDICIKDFDSFVDRRTFVVENEVLGNMLVAAKGMHWKGIRSVLSPTFSSGKIKNMFNLVQSKSEALLDYCEREKDDQMVVDLDEGLTKYTMDVIASCAFGMETNTLGGENEDFLDAAETLFKFNFTFLIKYLLVCTCKPLFKLLNLKNDNPKLNYFTNIVKSNIETRKEKGPRRGDFIDLMLDSKKSAEEKKEEEKASSHTLTDDSIIAQCLLFLVAGIDTTANALKFAVLLLAKNKKHQDKLREELVQLVDKSQDGQLDYQAVMDSEYLDAVFAETVRLYPPGATIERVCTRDYTIRGTTIAIEKGSVVSVPVYSLHRDERYFPDPEQFHPHRFLTENKKNIPHGAYIPFGLGPRMCIAQRFALMEAKLALVALVLNYHLSLVAGCEEVTLNTLPGILQPKKGTTKIKLQKVNRD